MSESQRVAFGDRRRLAWRMAKLWAFPMSAALYTTSLIVPVLRQWGLPDLAAKGMGSTTGVLLSGVLLAPAFKMVRWGCSDDYEQIRQADPLAMSLFCTASVVVTGALLASVGVSPPLMGLLPWTVVLAVGAAVGARRYAIRNWMRMLERVLKVEQPLFAVELVELCRDELRENWLLSEEERTTVRLTLAGALIASRVPGDGRDALREGLEILDEAGRFGPPALVYPAAAQMVDGMRVKAQRTGDDVGWDPALDVLARVAERAAPKAPEAPGVALAARAARLDHQAATANDETEAEHLRAAAIDLLERAATITPVHCDEYALHRIAVARRARGVAHPLLGDLNQAITTCRRAARRLMWTDSGEWATAQIACVELLELRAELAPGRARVDLMRAIWICLELRFLGERDADARAQLPELRDRLFAAKAGDPSSGIDRRTGEIYAAVFAEQMELSYSRAAVLAARWGERAVGRGDTAQAAEAWWCWVTATAADLRRRVLHDKEHHLVRDQALFTEAAERLIYAGRLRDAALALDLGRAVVLTERMHRDRDGLEERLLAAGHTDLALAWRAAEAQIERADRAALDGPSLSDLSGVASAEYVALTEHERLLGDIGKLPDFQDVDATPNYEDLRAAAAEGPIVYLAPREGGGFALIVTEAPDPVWVALPALTHTRVAGYAAQVPATNTPAQTAAVMPKLLPELWEHVLAPLSPHLPSGALVTLIPIGELGELPLHMASVAEDAEGVWRDRLPGLAFRYAPNVRVLLQAQRRARGLAGEAWRTLTVGVSDAAGETPLPNATFESRALADLLGPDRTERPDPAGVASVRAALERCEVWHFACHGTQDPLSPMESTLALCDGRLSVRELFAQERGRRRLAVLSACQTTATSGPLPDEVIGFPSAMLQAGVAGVVSCQADVDDEAAMFLVLAFFARCARTPDLAPPRALAEAQAWLRTATNDQIHQMFPEVHPIPSGDWTDPVAWRAWRPFTAPSTWVLFTYTGA